VAKFSDEKVKDVAVRFAISSKATYYLQTPRSDARPLSTSQVHVKIEKIMLL
jgi:hypothetical protein